MKWLRHLYSREYRLYHENSNGVKVGFDYIGYLIPPMEVWGYEIRSVWIHFFGKVERENEWHRVEDFFKVDSHGTQPHLRALRAMDERKTYDEALGVKTKIEATRDQFVLDHIANSNLQKKFETFRTFGQRPNPEGLGL